MTHHGSTVVHSAWHYTKIALAVVTCPCWLLPMMAYIKYDDRQKSKLFSDEQFQKRRAYYEPTPLPAKRERRLSLPLEDPAPIRKRGLQTTADQSECMLLSKLPPDVRLMIWDYVLGGELIHITRRPGRLGNVICYEKPRKRRNVNKMTSQHSCWNPEDVDGILYADLIKWPQQDRMLLPILRTCRQIYSEAIHTLYSANTFDVIHLDALIALRSTLLPDRFTAIRSLRLSWTFRCDLYQMQMQNIFPKPPHDHLTWLQACMVLRSMTGLRDLRVLIEGGGWMSEEPHSALFILTPLAQIKQVNGNFTVVVPWPETALEKVMLSDDLPFEIVRCPELVNGRKRPLLPPKKRRRRNPTKSFRPWS